MRVEPGGVPGTHRQPLFVRFDQPVHLVLQAGQLRAQHGQLGVDHEDPRRHRQRRRHDDAEHGAPVFKCHWEFLGGFGVGTRGSGVGARGSGFGARDSGLESALGMALSTEHSALSTQYSVPMASELFPLTPHYAVVLMPPEAAAAAELPLWLEPPVAIAGEAVSGQIRNSGAASR